MLKNISTKMRDEDKGFTLIELMVVVLIIGILIAIALPTFLGARDRANDKAGLSNLRNGMAAAKTFFTDKDVYTGFNAAQGLAIEPSLTWVDGGVLAVNEVHDYGVSATQVVLSTKSASGKTFCIADDATVGTHIGVSAAGAAIGTYAACLALPVP